MREKLKRIRRRAKHFVIPFLVGFGVVWAVFDIISRLQRPEYAAVVIAVFGFGFTLWLEAFREISNQIRHKLGLLSQLRIELRQNEYDIKSVLDSCRANGEELLNPAPLRTHAWLAATASPYFAKVDGETVDQLIQIYNGLDVANYYAGVFKHVAYSPQAIDWDARQMAESSRRMYVDIVTVVSGQVGGLLRTMEARIEQLREY